MGIKNCVHCGSLFQQQRSEQYCSLKCAVLHRSDIKGSDECWNWTGAVSSNGYGMFSFLSTMYTSHRASYLAHHGAIPSREGSHGGVVMHACDNRLCVNPKHLSVGSQKENLLDARTKGRSYNGGPKGEAARTAILTEQDVLDIRHRLSAGESGASLAKEFGVTVSAISSIRTRKTWKHI